MKLLKFCNIKNIFETRTAASMSIPFLGFHLISENDFSRYDDIKFCARELRTYYHDSRAILVTKERDINKLSSVLKEIEFDGIQLHYPDSDSQASALRGEFGKHLIIFQVISPEMNEFIPSEADYILLDKSYLGGTGLPIENAKINETIDRLKAKNVFLAGGISPSNLYQYLDYAIEGFDIQSAIKSDHSSKQENTDYLKMVTLAKLLGYEINIHSGQVGFVVQDIKQQNQKLLTEAIESKVDFLHIDISDGFVGDTTEIFKTKKLLETIRKTNSHLRIQAHFFVASEGKYEKISDQLELTKYFNFDIFLHINRDNYSNFSKTFIQNKVIYFAIDTKDVTDETFPWEPFIKEQVLMCMQSREHSDRLQNLNRGLKLIRYSTNIQPVINIDRSVDYDVVLGLEDSSLVNIVCGSYLRENISERYQLLKHYLYGNNK